MNRTLHEADNAQRILKLTADTMLLVDRNGICIDIDIHSNLWFLQEERLLGKNIFELMPEHTREKVYSTFETVLREQRSISKNYKLELKDDTYYFKCIMYPYDDKDVYKRQAYYLPSLQAPGGIERIVTFKANYFAEHFEGYDITIITSEQMGKAPHFPLSPKVKHIDLGVSFDLPYSQSTVSKVLKYPFRYYRFKQRLSNLLNELKPDITISTMRRELNFITKLKDGSLKIGEFHVSRYAYGAEALKRKSPIVNMIKKRWANRFVKNLSKLSRVIILTSEGAKDWPELTNISIIPNPISTPVEGKQTDILSHNAIAVGR